MIIFSHNGKYFSLILHWDLTNISFLMVSFNVESKTILMTFLQPVYSWKERGNESMNVCNVIIVMKIVLISGSPEALWPHMEKCWSGDMALVKLACLILCVWQGAQHCSFSRIWTVILYKPVCVLSRRLWVLPSHSPDKQHEVGNITLS